LTVVALDSSVLVAAFRDEDGSRAKLVRAASEVELAVSPIVIFELMFGAFSSPRVDAQLRNLRRLMEGLHVTELTESDAVTASRVGAALVAAGREIGAYDTLIAGQALNRGWAVTTRNTKHFRRVPDLETIDWSRAWGARS
jgi:tRNA(fMet)-specific endonuclease VapC